jgi:hypothetical protein
MFQNTDQQDAASLREELYRVINNYADFAKLAQTGEVNPIGQIGRILQKTVPYLLLVIRDLLPLLEKDTITYYEALYSIIRAAQQFPDQQALKDSREEIQKIEEEGKIFLYAAKWIDSPSNTRPSPQDCETIQKKLGELNEKYKSRYSQDEETATMIPCFLVRNETDSKEAQFNRIADLVRRALLEMHHLMVEYEPAKRFFIFTSPTRKEIEDDLMQLAWFLFRSGYPVERIATGYYKDSLASFLNEKLIDHLLSTQDSLNTLSGISRHLCLISLLDFGSFFEIPADYRPLDDGKEITAQVKALKNKNRRGGALLKKVWDLQVAYGSKPLSRIVRGFLLYRYYMVFADYHAEHRVSDARAKQAIKLYKPILDQSAMEKRAEQDLQKSSRSLSTKTREEMASLIRLIMGSLTNPGKVKGKKLKVLGDISSGAMGSVSIGIYENQIVALKVVKTQMTAMLGDPEGLLQYEAALNERVQRPEQHPCIVEYYGMVEQDDQKLLINGYYPCDNLTQLVEKNWQEKYKPPFNTRSKVTLATIEIVVNQLLDCLRLFRKKGVVHRDLKTDNILYTVDEKEDLNRIKIIDFGVAMAVGPGAMPDMFKGKVVGTFSYMAPEQAKSKSSFQSDLYSAGAILTVLLTGKLPMIFPKTKTRKDLLEQLRRIEHEARPKLTTLNPFLTKNTTLEHVAATVERMLDLDFENRPNVEEIQEAFDGVFQHIGNEKYNESVFYHRD